jgi:hypothetical protein
MPMIAFSPRAAATVLYVGPGLEKTLLSKLGRHKVSGSCLYVPKLDEIDAKALERIAANAWAHMRRKANGS